MTITIKILIVMILYLLALNEPGLSRTGFDLSKTDLSRSRQSERGDLWQNKRTSNQNLRAFWKPANRQNCVLQTLYRMIMKTIL